MKKHSLIFLLLTLLLISCGRKSKTVEFKLVSDFSIDDSVYSVIERYTRQFPQFNSFVLTCFLTKPPTNALNNNSYNEYLLGPAYYWRDSLKDPIMFFNIDGKRIFVKCGLEDIVSLNQKGQKYYEEYSIPRGADSAYIGAQLYAKNGNFLYLKRSIYFWILDDRIIINDRPDTIFLPKFSDEVIIQTK